MKNMSSIAIWIFIATILSRIFAFIRESSLAAVFGVSFEVDAYNVAQTLSSFLFSFIGVAIGSVGIPTLSALYSQKRHKEFNVISWSFFNFIALSLSILVIIGILITPFLVKIIAPGFNSDQAELAISLTKIIMPTILFLGLSGWATVVLQAQNKFLVPAFATIPNNIILILAILYTSSFQNDIMFVAKATLLAFLSQFLFQLPSLLNLKYIFGIRYDNKDFRKMLKMFPSTIGTAIGGQASQLVDRIFASGLAIGSISILSYSQRAFGLVTGLIQMPLLIVLFPKLAASAEENKSEFSTLVKKGLVILTYLMVPCSVGLILFSIPIIQLLFQRGAFDNSDTFITSTTLIFYTIGLPFIGWRDYLVRAFYGLKDTRTPMLSTIYSLLINLLLNILLVRLMGVQGLALSTSVSTIIGVIYLLYKLKKTLKGYMFSIKYIYISLIKSLAASLLMVLVILAICYFLNINLFSITISYNYFFIASLVLISIFVYWLGGKIFKATEVLMLFRTVFNLVLDRFCRR